MYMYIICNLYLFPWVFLSSRQVMSDHFSGGWSCFVGVPCLALHRSPEAALSLSSQHSGTEICGTPISSVFFVTRVPPSPHLSNVILVCAASLQCYCGTATADFDRHGASTNCNSECAFNMKQCYDRVKLKFACFYCSRGRRTGGLWFGLESTCIVYIFILHVIQRDQGEACRPYVEDSVGAMMTACRLI